MRLLLALIATLAGAAAPLAAQTDVIRGTVTNAEAQPLPDVRGNYRIAFPGGTGDYMMGFALIGYVFRQYEIKRLADEEVLVADARLAVIQLDTISVTAPIQQRVGRNSQ